MEQKPTANAKPDGKPPFENNYRVAKLSLFGVGGFILGTIFLFYSDLYTFFTNDSIFHEVRYVPRELVKGLADSSIKALTDNVNARKEKIASFGPSTNPDTLQRKKELQNLNGIDTPVVAQLKYYRQFYSGVADADTNSFRELNKALHFQVTPGTLNQWDESFKNAVFSSAKKSVPIGSTKFYFRDVKVPYDINGTAVIYAVRPANDIEFIAKYPSAGVWIMMILLFCSFCAIVIPAAFHLHSRVLDLFGSHRIPRKDGFYSYLKICGYVALVMGLLAVFWNRTFYDDDIVKDVYFMRHLNVSMPIVIALGSIAGTVCLGGFIYTSSLLGNFEKPLVSANKAVREQRKLVGKVIAPTDPGNSQQPVPGQIELDNKIDEQTKLQAEYDKLAGIFQNYFLLASAILSIMVLCTGALFSTINSLDFIKLLADDWGYSPVRSDFVYLYGGLYSIILLLVYVPAKMRFSEVNSWAKKSEAGDNAKWTDLIKNPFGELKSVLVATSPLLVSVVQSLFETLFK